MYRERGGPFASWLISPFLWSKATLFEQVEIAGRPEWIGANVTKSMAPFSLNYSRCAERLSR